MTTHGGARPKTRSDDARGGARQGAGRKRQTWRVWAKLGETEFLFDTGRRNEAEAVAAFAKQVGYEVRIEKQLPEMAERYE